ncbi:GNAT family N-acetyltransferase [Wohlfahrtiimonas chitiniclastica]|uniref:GNAT family N-acetyltransferase n=1 Tax=Wohlfahrtiimonas chitiniclastica TaxID=400946 RepID=UPI0003661EF2|nr:GNAT family N-acetyltransferase [Wohlfahrtiimonas chitiniclastica]
MTISLIDCTEREHSAAILEIFNEAILTSTALYEYQARTMQDMQTWFKQKSVLNAPIIGAVNDAGQLLGFATWGRFRAYPAYQYTMEHSIYIHRSARGQGLSKRLMRALIEAAKAAEIHVLMGCIDADNAASIGLHRSLGFQSVGLLPQVGFKFGRWLDLALYQLILSTPLEPVAD